MGEKTRHTSWSWAWFGRGVARFLCAHHYRPGSDPVRVAVRAVSEPRTRVDARFRYRLLPGPQGRGDPIRARALRARPGRADHHLRHVAGARRSPRRRPRFANAIR